MLLCMAEAVEGELCLLDVLEVLEVPDVMRFVLLCMLEAVEGVLRLLEVIRCAILCMLDAVEPRRSRGALPALPLFASRALESCCRCSDAE